MTCLYHCLPQKCFEAVNAGQKTKSFQNKLKANSCSQRFLDTSCFDQNQRPRGRPETKKQHQRKRHKIMTCLYHCLPQKCFEAVNAGQKTKSFQNKLKANSCSQRFLDTSCFDQNQRPRGRPETKKQHQRKRHKIMTCLYHCLPQKCFEAVNAGQKTKSFQNKLKANSCSQRFLDTSCFDQNQRPRGRPETKKQHQRKRHKIMTCLYHCLPQKCFEAVNAG